MTASRRKADDPMINFEPVNLFRWLGSWNGDDFAREIVEEFRHNCRPEVLRGSDQAAVEKRVGHAIEVLANRAAKFHRQHRLGWFSKARLLSALKWQLRGAGHGDEVVREVLYAVLLKTAR